MVSNKWEDRILYAETSIRKATMAVRNLRLEERTSWSILTQKNSCLVLSLSH